MGVKTILNHRAAISRFARFLMGLGLLVSDPVKAVPSPRVEKPPPAFLTASETEKALQLAEEHGIYAEVLLALRTGLRLGELRQLEWRDVDLSGRTLIVRRAKSKRFRAVPLCQEVIEALSCQKQQTGDCQYVFPGRIRWGDSGMRGHSWWQYALRPLQEAIPKFQQAAPGSVGRGWHLLRHTFASRLVQQGVSLYKVARWLGHSDVRTTEIYAHLRERYDEDIERLEGTRR